MTSAVVGFSPNRYESCNQVTVDGDSRCGSGWEVRCSDQEDFMMKKAVTVMAMLALGLMMAGGAQAQSDDC
nr:hypothetical protein [Candidatus Krumholzibacteria bacterium]